MWREKEGEAIRKYELTTVTYGTASSPYLAQRCIKQLAMDNAALYPKASNTIANDFYMDNWISGSESISQLLQLREEVTLILATAGMELRKWNSNVSDLLTEGEIEVPLTSNEEVKTLGIRWNSREDVFKFKLMMPEKTSSTKRSILSVIAQIYDPLGLIGPVVTKAKLFMRSLWKLSVSWDDEIPSDLLLEWNSYKERLEAMEEVRIPRHVVSQETSKIEMHGFCDASQLAYGACIYLCSSNAQGERSSKLLVSKSRIAPLKVLSIPRLELCSAVLLARLAFKVRKAITPIQRYIYWSNLSIVIHWIRGEPTKYKVFVANRVAEIQELTRQNEWRHVRTKFNPADLFSRGMDPRELPNSEMWWAGPHWLGFSQDQWSNEAILEEPLEEKATERILVANYQEERDLLEKFSLLSKLQRVIAYCNKFIRNCRKNVSQDKTKSLQADDIREANLILIRMTQRHAFPQEIQELSKEKGGIPRNSRILSLNPFLDERGILRVGDRLKNADLAYDQQFPIILPSNNPFFTLLIRDMHYKYLHAIQYLHADSIL
ncbi:PREDICTED: uncharacterized protein LOC108761000 [Trachymyrmex cornetzi]|uniref:uncharacterized protein LOC108761000 n=1 Tax=Trachymyrmex cornetzi TaxID=471704 RepID=UPI00084F80AF|nr:PREDICTED: uncharacterized protein LOC108761000 [Trachymyrmex cornetzi]